MRSAISLARTLRGTLPRCWTSSNARVRTIPCDVGGLTPPEEQLGGIEDLVSNDFAFTARREDGSAICWGAAQNGGAFDAVVGYDEYAL